MSKISHPPPVATFGVLEKRISGKLQIERGFTHLRRLISCPNQPTTMGCTSLSQSRNALGVEYTFGFRKDPHPSPSYLLQESAANDIHVTWYHFRLRHASTAVTVKRNTRNCCRSSNIQNVARSGSFSREKNNQTGSSEGQHLAETTAASASHRDEDPVVSNNSSEDDGKQGNDNNDMDGRNVPTGSTTVVVASSSVTEGKAPSNSHKAAVTGGRE